MTVESTDSNNDTLAAYYCFDIVSIANHADLLDG